MVRPVYLSLDTGQRGQVRRVNGSFDLQRASLVYWRVLDQTVVGGEQHEFVVARGC